MSRGPKATHISISEQTYRRLLSCEHLYSHPKLPQPTPGVLSIPCYLCTSITAKRAAPSQQKAQAGCTQRCLRCARRAATGGAARVCRFRGGCPARAWDFRVRSQPDEATSAADPRPGTMLRRPLKLGMCRHGCLAPAGRAVWLVRRSCSVITAFVAAAAAAVTASITAAATTAAFTIILVVVIPRP